MGEWCSGGTHCDWSFSSLRFYNFTLICSGMRDKSKSRSNLCGWALTIQAIWLWPLLGVNFVALQGTFLRSPAEWGAVTGELLHLCVILFMR